MRKEIEIASDLNHTDSAHRHDGGCLQRPPLPDIPRVMEIAKKFGLEFLPPLGA
ncbi:MAG TPA: hypothetical protein VK840_01260 [Candidatus Dormibacteraeota bacterium]|nr:hypothetical protein [Candidatus Dormibacteraeota bacterium]